MERTANIFGLDDFLWVKSKQMCIHMWDLKNCKGFTREFIQISADIEFVRFCPLELPIFILEEWLQSESDSSKIALSNGVNTIGTWFAGLLKNPIKTHWNPKVLCQVPLKSSFFKCVYYGCMEKQICDFTADLDFDKCLWNGEKLLVWDTYFITFTLNTQMLYIHQTSPLEAPRLTLHLWLITFCSTTISWRVI